MARVVCPEVPHHITQRGVQRSNIFLDEADHRRYLELLACYAPKFGLEITSYCVMTNHVHIVGVPEREDSIGKVFRDCHGIYAAEFNKKYGKTGHVWQARPYSCVLDEAHTWAAIRYVEPSVPSPAANYVHAVRTGNHLYLAGKGVHVSGKVGREFTKEQAYQFARDTGLILLAVMKLELATLQRVKRVVKVLGMVNAIPEFGDHPFVINGCSDLFVEVFGEAGRHARSAVGVASLPFNVPVEIEAIIEVTEP